MKYTFEFKLDCVNRQKKGERIICPFGPKPKTFFGKVRDWGKLYDVYGVEGLKHKNFNKEWTAEERFSLVAKALAGEPIKTVALAAGIDTGQLWQWVRRYRENGMEGLQCMRKGRPPRIPIMKPKNKRAKLAPSEKEELKLLKARNEFLEMENIYLKKLDALVSKREAAHPKARKRKSSRQS